MKRFISVILTVCLVLPLFSYISVVPASASYDSEMWLKTDCEYMLIRGRRVKIKDDSAIAPFKYNAQTAQVPLTALCEYSGGSYTLKGKEVTVNTGKATYTLTVDSLIWSGSSEPLYAPPVLKDGEVYVSLLTLQSVFGLKCFYHTETGLIVVSENVISLNKSYSSTKSQIETMSKLLFDNVSGEDIINDAIENLGSLDLHPYLFVSQERLDYIRENYLKSAGDTTRDDELFDYTNFFVEGKAVHDFNDYFTLDDSGEVVFKDGAQLELRHPYYIYDENGNRLEGVSEYTYPDGTTVHCDGSGYGDGYDEGGRLSSSARTLKMKRLAFAYQATGDAKYARAAYLLGIEMGKWEHWGDGHFLNCAESAMEFAMAYDWIYNYLSEAQRLEFSDILYEKTILPAYYSILARNYNGGYYPESYLQSVSDYLHRSTIASTGYRVLGHTNNWQTVCSGGIVISALALLERTDNSDMREKITKVLGTLLPEVKVCLYQYAPDGSYIESPAYWTYGTQYYMYMLAALENTSGTSYGYFDTVGLKDSCYFAYYINNPQFYAWSYHDSTDMSVSGKANLEPIAIAAKYYNDTTLAYFRKLMLTSEVSVVPSLMDVLYYDPDLAQEPSEPIPLDYFAKNIDTVTMRSGWEQSGYNFVGLHAGANNVNHGDIDSGNFIIQMGGVNWFGDMGSENYNVGNYFSSHYLRYRYYKKTAEAHNTILIMDKTDSSLWVQGKTFAGQTFNSMSDTYAKIVRFEEYGDLGAIAVADMKAQYGKNCTAAKRGLLFTNSRTTAVIQDEISFATPTDLIWVASSNSVQSISSDGRSAYLYATDDYGNPIRLRASLLSEDESLKFEIYKSSEDVLLPETETRDNTSNDKASNPIDRLIIRANGITEFNTAVVFELYEDKREVVGYEKTDIDLWQVSDGEWIKDANDAIINNPDYRYTLLDLVYALNKIERAKTEEEKMSLVFSYFDRCIYIDKSDSMVKAKISEYMQYVNEYNELVEEENKKHTQAEQIALGTNKEE